MPCARAHLFRNPAIISSWIPCTIGFWPGCSHPYRRGLPTSFCWRLVYLRAISRWKSSIGNDRVLAMVMSQRHISENGKNQIMYKTILLMTWIKLSLGSRRILIKSLVKWDGYRHLVDGQRRAVQLSKHQRPLHRGRFCNHASWDTCLYYTRDK